MTVSEYFSSLKINSRIAESLSCGDFILALNINGSSEVSDYAVFNNGVTDIKADTLSEIEKRKFISSGSSVAKTYVVRKFSVTMDYVSGDSLCSYLTSPSVIFARDDECVIDYIFISARSKSGEKGKALVDSKSFLDGGYADEAVITADIYSVSKPENYTYGG